MFITLLLSLLISYNLAFSNELIENTQQLNYAQILPPQQPYQSQTIKQTNTQTPPLSSSQLIPIISQTSTIFPKDLNPLDYQDKIETTIYQQSNRLIIIQSIPLKYIQKALTPNVQPTITDYPIL